MSDEAHLSTEQPGPRPPARLSPSQRDGRRPQETQRLAIIRKRSDFLAANAGRRASSAGFVLLVRDRGDGDPAKRVGFTVTKKIGGAVVRNRMKRRLQALARELLPTGGFPGADHVLIGRSGGIERDFALLRQELANALERLRK